MTTLAPITTPAIIRGILYWKYMTRFHIYGRVVIGSDGTIYTASDYLYAFTSSGSLKWSFNGHFLSAPAIGSDGTLYIGSNEGYLCALSSVGSLM